MSILRNRRSFTLIELLLVVAILSIVAAVTVPAFARSIKGNRLRVAVRTAVTAGRYARSMAVLKQQEMMVRFDLATSEIRVAAVDATPVSPVSADLTTPADAVSTNRTAGSDELRRKLDRVRIDYVDLGSGERRVTGTAEVIYDSNGRCKPYSLRVSDEEGVSMLIEVDALASARTVGEGI